MVNAARPLLSGMHRGGGQHATAEELWSWLLHVFFILSIRSNKTLGTAILKESSLGALAGEALRPIFALLKFDVLLPGFSNAIESL